MRDEFPATFAALKRVLEGYSTRMVVRTDAPTEYTLVTKSPSPFPQHKGQPMPFGSVRLGKAYVSFHLMPLYMNENVAKSVSPSLKKHQQGKSCFNFKADPDREMLADLTRLTDAAYAEWTRMGWA